MDIRFMLNSKISAARGINGLHFLLLSVMLITTNLYRLVKHSNCHYNQTKQPTYTLTDAHILTHKLNPRILFHNITTLLDDNGWNKNQIHKILYTQMFRMMIFKFILHYPGMCIWLWYFWMKSDIFCINNKLLMKPKVTMYIWSVYLRIQLWGFIHSHLGTSIFCVTISKSISFFVAQVLYM